MTRTVLLALLVLSACSNQEAGRSEAFETIGVAPPTPNTVQLNTNAAPVTLGELRGSINGSDPSPLTGDEALVDSLNAAIANAGQPGATPAPAPIPEASENTPAAESAATTTTGAALPQQSETITDNSFQRVVAEETIETDRQKLEELSKQRVELEAEPLPERSADVNLAAFARSTDHKIGERIYRRSGTRSTARASASCRKYRNPDEAQRAFIARGGPESDPMRIDPDGDGFVCGWSPIPFRALNLSG